MSQDGNNIIGGRIPSVQTRWTGSGTAVAVTQAFVIFVALWIALAVVYLSIRYQVSFDTWHAIASHAGFWPAILVTRRLWVNFYYVPAWAEQWAISLGERRNRGLNFYRLMRLIANLWPLYVYAVYTRFVPVIASLLDKQIPASIMLIGALSIVIACVFLVYRMTTELLQPLAGNSIEIAVKKMEIDQDRWKVLRDRSIDQLVAQNERQANELDAARLALRNKQRTRVVYQIGNMTQRTDETLDDDALFNQFVYEAWTTRRTRDEWCEWLVKDPATETAGTDGRARYDSYRDVLIKIGAWNKKSGPIVSIDEVCKSLSIPLPRPELYDETGGVPENDDTPTYPPADVLRSAIGKLSSRRSE